MHAQAADANPCESLQGLAVTPFRIRCVNSRISLLVPRTHDSAQHTIAFRR